MTLPKNGIVIIDRCPSEVLKWYAYCYWYMYINEAIAEVELYA